MDLYGFCQCAAQAGQRQGGRCREQVGFDQLKAFRCERECAGSRVQGVLVGADVDSASSELMFASGRVDDVRAKLEPISSTPLKANENVLEVGSEAFLLGRMLILPARSSSLPAVGSTMSGPSWSQSAQCLQRRTRMCWKLGARRFSWGVC